ncbi:pyridoxamine 5'-phosphate oxidase [Shewanella sp. NIFS-20-20]|uniref:pyridoxamine 5'-phosphate oxidase n=1 Tax=Shewanella sp. NIFS-20-20 TaxID=2853806 RepID=UPI001C450CBB|nr:pyridoxamine 5'-phosphate oxidase [Shewanella sp. NIFS-20-20]MBV7314379.1 pyridoxamine 5'-phosphate oxidase [Shewanella sp. NIFS-20-20]
MIDLTHIRREYLKDGLRAKDLPVDPMALFELWMSQAADANLSDPTAMVVATVDDQGQPWQRIVLLKRFDEHGFVFFTNLGSRKATQLKHNSHISLLFPWHMLERQVAVTGVAQPLSTAEVVSYFMHRPKDSQIAAWVSKQSSPLSTRGVLEAKFLEMKQKFSKGEVPVPSFWGGYRVRASHIEFWQGGANRLHDRFLYTRQEATSAWEIERLAP